MARYAGPVCRRCRHVGDKLMLKGNKCVTHCTLDRRSRPPGQTQGRRRRISDRGVQLMEKQKVRYTYGMLERQFRQFFREAQRQAGSSGDNLLVLLERRLDNTVHRLGFADSRSQARQLILHGHITVNGRRVDVPSFLIKEGDSIGWKESSKKTSYFKQLAEGIQAKTIASWLSLDRDNMVGRVTGFPMPEETGVKLDGKAVVEYYSR